MAAVTPLLTDQVELVRQGERPRATLSDVVALVSASAVWGNITGSLSSQADLSAALAAKGTSNFSGAYAALTGKPTLGTAAATASTDYATAAQGAKADSALQGISAGSITLAMQANMATGSIVYRKTAGSGAPEIQTIATLKTDLALAKADVGLGNVDNTSDASKPISTATQTALNGKQAAGSYATTSHASTHAIDGTDPVVPMQVYFRDEPLVIASGNVLILPTGMIWTDATVTSDAAFMVNEPTNDKALFPGSTTIVDDDPYIVDSGYLVDLTGNPNTILWTNAARCPQTVSTLLIIGV